MVSLIYVILFLALAYGVWRLLSRVIKKTTVYEYQSGLKYNNGKFVELLGAGGYWHNELSTTITTIDTRPSIVTIPSQEVLSKDGVAVKLSLAATITVTHPEIAAHEIGSYQRAYYLIIQQALRVVVADIDIEALLEQRANLGPQIESLISADLKKIGVEAASIGVKDITFPGSLKQTFAQVVQARQDGLAALERARGESAALRNLANSAKMMENNPALMHLRTLQALDASSGNTLVLNMTSEKQNGTAQFTD